jgi:hypothetical protein
VSAAPASIRQLSSQAANENRCHVTREPDQEMETKTTVGRLGGRAAERRLNIARERVVHNRKINVKRVASFICNFVPARLRYATAGDCHVSNL